MQAMSRYSTKDYSDDYLGEWTPRKRSRRPAEACRVTDLERKYLNNILLGHQKYRERKSRG